ncbi:MAG: DNA translocase FtsK 4TM domain-containing protein [Alphaproteobacteria bacterium]|nr:DNA translocase FtsK 4TM domain-containing protein [Alphaproteobacteria bacterium]
MFLRFLQARLREGFGLFIMALTSILALALANYTPTDASWNRVSHDAVANWLGVMGAIIADMSMQIFGIGIWALLPAGLAYGWRRICNHMIRFAWVRWLAWVGGFICLSFAAALWPQNLHSAHPPAGGLLGLWFSAWLNAYVFVLLPDWAALIGINLSPNGVIMVRIGASLCFVSLAIACALSAAGGWQLSIKSVRALAHFISKLGQIISKIKTASIRRLHLPQNIRNTRATHNTHDTPDKAQAVPKTTTQTQKAAVPVDMPTPKPRPSKRATREAQHKLPLDAKTQFELPPLHLLAEPRQRNRSKISQDALEANARLLENVLSDFGIHGTILRVRPGPVVTLYELEPAAGIRSARVVGLADDIARSMSAVACRIATVPGHNVIGIELPNSERETVYLRELLSSSAFENNNSHLPIALGKDIGGDAIFGDLAKMPHLLVAGTTGSGKSVGVNAMILSILYRMSPQDCRFIMIDPKMLELSVYEGIPHLLAPVVTEPKQAVIALKWAVQEMENRYRKMSKIGVRNIEGFNERMREAAKKGDMITRRVQTGFDPETGEARFEEEQIRPEKLPFIIIVIDEMADLMLVSGKEIEGVVQRLAQMARAAGVHLITATQRPSVDVITGTIKANFPSRIAFQVTSKIDSRTILGDQGAEQLLGLGDMLFMAGGGRLQRVHGPFVSDEEVSAIVGFLKKQGRPNYLENVTKPDDENGEENSTDEQASLYDQAVAIVTRDNRVSISYVQRRLSIGYNRAAGLVEQMEENGVISAPNHAGKREVLANKV